MDVKSRAQVTRADAGFDLEVYAYDCAQTKRIATVTARADSQDDLLPALGRAQCEKMQVCARWRRCAHIAWASSGTISGNDTESKTYYKLAIDLDPQFALAYLQIGRAYSNTGEPSLSRDYYQHAFDLRERTTVW